jgi:signal transduction histidine kinase
MRGMRGAVVATAVASGVTIGVIGLLPGLHVDYRWSALHVALETTTSLVALLAAFLAVSRLWRRTLLGELALASALALRALSDLCFRTLPIVGVPGIPGLTAWAALIGSMLGALLFALGAFVPRQKLRKQTLVLAGRAGGIIVVTVLALVLAGAFLAGVPHGLVTDQQMLPGAHRQPVLPGPQIVMAMLYSLAAIGYLSRSQELGDEFLGWLAISAALATASCVAYFLYPVTYSDSGYIGEVFRLLSYAVLFVGSMREIWSYWRALSGVAVLEERRRLARDLHDGLAQELAYLARNLKLLDEETSSETLRRLRRAVERAQVESRRAIRALAPPSRQALDVALAEAASEITERFNIELAFDSVADVRLSETRAEALVRIACEAVTNAARHSGAGRVHLSLTRDGQRVRLRVTDSGCGFNPNVRVGGFGLISIQERAQSVGGELRISSVPGRGSQVEAVL